VKRSFWVAALLGAALAHADVYVLTDGDRITGKTVAKTGKAFGVQTAYGRLTIPAAKVARIVHDDGKEEVVTAVPTPEPTPTPAPPVQLILVITGKTFWYAWDKPPADTRLRFEVRLDEETAASYIDAKLDPDQLPGATVNAFGFGPDEAVGTGAAGVTLAPAEARPGRIVLKIELPLERAGERKLRLAYQANDATAEEPAWHDLAEGGISLTLKPDAPTFVQIRQDRGRMEYSGFPKKRMRNVETFRLEAKPE